MPAAEADRPGKVFVGGLASDIDEAVLEKYFSHYGRLTEGKYNISIHFLNSDEKNTISSQKICIDDVCILIGLALYLD